MGNRRKIWMSSIFSVTNLWLWLQISNNEFFQATVKYSEGSLQDCRCMSENGVEDLLRINSVLTMTNTNRYCTYHHTIPSGRHQNLFYSRKTTPYMWPMFSIEKNKESWKWWFGFHRALNIIIIHRRSVASSAQCLEQPTCQDLLETVFLFCSFTFLFVNWWK